jgi:hypothetical protein
VLLSLPDLAACALGAVVEAARGIKSKATCTNRTWTRPGWAGMHNVTGVVSQTRHCRIFVVQYYKCLHACQDGDSAWRFAAQLDFSLD